MTPRQNEAVINAKIAAALRERHPKWNEETLMVETTGVFRETNKRPDILVQTPGRQPVCIETEFDPARTVEKDANERLGAVIAKTGEAIESVLAVILPVNLKTDSQAQAQTAQYRYAALQLGSDRIPTRFPEKGWLDGDIDDLADAIEHLSLSEARIAASTKVLQQVVNETAGLLATKVTEDIQAELAACLHQSEGEQTHRMAAAIFVSAFVFHAAIDGQPDIPRIQPLLPPEHLTQSKVLQVWENILEVNYWPIFSIAKDLATLLPNSAAPTILGRVAESVEELSNVGATTYHDLCGRMFQTLISDRKFLATFYTLPASACYLAELAVTRLKVDWANAEAIKNLQIGDFACGTGALLSAVQRAIYRRFRRAGGDDSELHAAMLERSLVGLDIMPAATHLTCSMLSAAYPTIGYGRSRIHTLPYGMPESEVYLGALDLRVRDQTKDIFGSEQPTERATTVTSSGEKVDMQQADVKGNSFDLVIMNPPFTRPTNHEAGHSNIPVPSFAGFNTSNDEQRHMSDKLKKMKGYASSGHAGLASNFIDLAHVKLKNRGVLALVLPLAFMSGSAWKKARKFLSKEYQNTVCIAIASVGQYDRAFSDDTSMGECLVLATKQHKSSSDVIQSHTLSSRPASLLAATIEAKLFDYSKTTAHVSAAGVRHESLVKAAAALHEGKLELPRMSSNVSVKIPIVSLSKVAKRGLVHRDISGGPTDRDKTGPPQGPFEVRELPPDYAPTYPALWAHDAEKERNLIVKPDSFLEIRPGDKERAEERWKNNVSRLHANLDFRLNSQSLAMCITPEEYGCIGGTAWPNIIVHDEWYEIPLCLWGNTTLGLIVFWWAGTRQQPGRSRLTISRLPELSVLDVRKLDWEQLKQCQQIFSDLEDKEFLPANQAWEDSVRKELDQRMLIDVLGHDSEILESLDILRRQWCSEPSVHGGKSTRPKNQ